MRLARRFALALLLVLAAGLGVALAVYPAEYVQRVLLWLDADVDDRLRFPAREIQARAGATELPRALDEARVRAAFAAARPGVAPEDWLAAQDSLGLVVLQHGQVVHEGYFNGHTREERATSFSVAKSVLSALVGAAIEDGLIASVDDPVTAHLPELGARDPRFHRITLRHLLGMRGGLRYRELKFLHGDDAKTYYFPDLRRLALEDTQVVGAPGDEWLYNNYHPLLLGLVLERRTGTSVSAYLERRLWQPAGMAAAASWSLDSAASGFEKLESGLNARVLDFARFGQLFLDGGRALDGTRVLGEAWVRAATAPDGAAALDTYRPGLYYQWFWWGQQRADGHHDYSARGNHGQFVYVSPRHGIVIARNGRRYGVSAGEWMRLFESMADAFGASAPRQAAPRP